MAFPLNDQIYTKSFTPREYQVELFYAAKEKDIIVCLGKNYEQTFIVIKLIQEFATNNRRLLSKGGKRSLYILKDEEKCIIKASYIQQLTDLKVLLCDTCSLAEFIEKFEISHINLVIVDECHKSVDNNKLKFILQTILSCENVARIIGLAVPLFNLTQEPGRLGLEIEKVENTFQCEVETASDILSILRYSPKPKEYVVEYTKSEKGELHTTIENYILHAIDFLRDHRHDPTEIYNEEFYEDIQKIPDPTEKPFEMMQDFLYILDSLGPWCADRAALALLILTEKLKIKTPYERHYLLLNMVASVFTKIRALCDSAFEVLSERERIFKYSTPKVHRLLQILKTYTPYYTKNINNSNDKINNENISQKLSTNNREGFMKDKFVQFKKLDCNWQNNEENCKEPSRAQHMRGVMDPDLLCGVIFVDKAFVAKVLFYLLNEISMHDEDLHFLSPLYMIERNIDDIGYSRDLGIEHKKQEEVLKRFRIHECNLLISTSILEEGIDIPKCNFVMRYDFPKTYQSYVQCRSRARATDALYVLLVPQETSREYVWQLAQYHYIEKVKFNEIYELDLLLSLLVKCSNNEPSEEEENEADLYAGMIPHYKPLDGDDTPKVTFNSAISLVNRYCAKLPSDIFTRLTPEWVIHKMNIDNTLMYICSLRLPINSPVKYVVSSFPMPNKAMARRMAALQLCIDLHRKNEIDDNLLPIGKENFKAKPEDAEVPALPDESKVDFSEARPGTTKRRQYYYKKTAETLTDCRPIIGIPSYLYHINLVLSCPLPEEQNTRGRRIYPPEESAIGFGIITLKEIPKLCPFPIYTRSGEVHVKLKLSKQTVILNEIQIEKIAAFLNYTFTNVLRLQQYLMLFDPNASENSYMIVPVKLDEKSDVIVDWNFLECIYKNRNSGPTKISEEVRKNFKFDASKYHDAVIMPWYRSQDQPQYFYVAEICTNLNPKSSFPGDGYSTFEEYYLKKYDIQIQNLDQPLLDVDHTSARLNFLTPSEETKRAKRENLEQKQILVAELCTIHPFPASLWRQAVCLPCILYRINALLLANQIRCQVAQMINLGQETLSSGMWPALDFGWSLAEVLKKSKESEKTKLARNDTIELNSTNNQSKDIVDNLHKSEAVEDEKQISKQEINKKILDLLESEKNLDDILWSYVEESENSSISKHKQAHYEFAKIREFDIMQSEYFIPCDNEIVIKRKTSVSLQPDENLSDYRHKTYIENVVDKFTKEILNKKDIIQPIKKNSNIPKFTYHSDNNLFSFDFQPKLENHPGPSPSLILQALTMSNANDGINLERLETIGDSFLKYAITTYLYCTYDNIHEGKLSHLRSKQVSNLNLYRLGRQKMLGESMIATKFEPHDNWLPPCYYVPKELEQALIESGVPSTLWNQADIPALQAVNSSEITQLVRETEQKLGVMKNELNRNDMLPNNLDNMCCFIPYNLITQHSIPDKSIADCVEALIGAYLIACGPRGALLFMAWLGIHVLPTEEISIVQETEPKERIPGSTPYIKALNEKGQTVWTQICYGKLEEPQNPLLRYIPDPEQELRMMLDGYEELEKSALTDLRSALVNNTIFASLAVRCGFHKYFRHLSPGLSIVINRFVRIQEENGHSISEEYYLIGEEECEEAEDVEVPKALGDVFESLAGAIYLDSGMSLDAVWSVYYAIMKNEIEQFSTNVPKSPIRELLELEPETAKFGKPEKLADGRRVRVTVDVFGKGSFKGIGRNYRIAKCTAAKCALKKLKRMQNYSRDKL
ncbi:Endoribonuclease Dicer [Eufriesea mexicana]|nr:Endoribonuclease Dicer [Eufriesea mexicana]